MTIFTLALTLTLLSPAGTEATSSHSIQETAQWPSRVLLTNDDGLNEKRLWALARAFSKQAMTYVVATQVDRSGSTNYAKLFGKSSRTLVVKRHRISDSLIAYGVDGYPADCVLFGLRGPFKDEPPDLVISGINGGSNPGTDSWFGSGTIGAARTAAFLGVPAIAVSGLDDDDQEMVDRLTDWVIRLAQSEVVQGLRSGQYLTVSVPGRKASEIQGIKLLERSPSMAGFEFVEVWSEGDDNQKEAEQVWLARAKPPLQGPPAESDIPWLQKGYIVIVPMQLDEHDRASLTRLQAGGHDIPTWEKPERK